MIRQLMIASLLMLFCVTQAAPHTVMNFRSVKVALPADDQIFPGGDKAAAINGNCLACHSAAMVLTQPKLTKAVWAAEIHKMVSVYKAPVSAQDADAIVAYLVQTNGKP
jgi:hypothetical protein